MSSFVEDMSLSDIQLSEADVLSEADRLMQEFGFPYKNKYGDTFYFLGVPHTSGASEAVVRVDGNGKPYSTFGPASTDADVTVIPGSVYLVKVYGKSGAVEVLDEVYFSHEDNARVAEILLDEDALPEDSEYYEEAYMEKYGDYPDSDVAYSYAEFEGDASRKYGVSDSVGQDFANDFLEGAARDLRKEFGEPMLDGVYGDKAYFVVAPLGDGYTNGLIRVYNAGVPKFVTGDTPRSGDIYADAGFVHVVAVDAASGKPTLLFSAVESADQKINYDDVALSLFQEGFLSDDNSRYEAIYIDQYGDYPMKAQDCSDGVTRMSDIGSSVPGRYPANRRSSGRQK